MSATEPLYLLLGMKTIDLSIEELFILEVELFRYVCEELKKFFRIQHKDYCLVMKLTLEKENEMLENIARFMIHDILATEEYTIAGIALYANVPPDVVSEIAMGMNIDPTHSVTRKLIELHRVVRPGLYKKILDKIQPRDFVKRGYFNHTSCNCRRCSCNHSKAINV
jgi:hypothetical protein